jgi:hypothetical protein
VRRGAGRKETIDDTPLVEHLDGAGLHPGRAGSVLGSMRTLFKQQHIDTTAAQLGGQGQAGGSGPGHNNRGAKLDIGHL